MKRIILFNIFFALGTFAFAQGLHVEKTYQESFQVRGSEDIDISNKYGEIIVHTWYKDSVKIKVKVTAQGRGSNDVQRELERIDIKIRKIGLIVSAVTEFDAKRSGFFGSLLDQVEDYSQSFGSSSKLSVDYEVWMPEKTGISIENKFGDIYLSNLKGKANIDLSHGDIRANRVEADLMLKHSFGRHTFDYVDEASITIRNAESQIGVANRLYYQSSSSEINVGKVKVLQINSRNDRYSVQEAGAVNGEGSFTDLILDYALSDVNLDFDYGDLYLGRIDKDFRRVALTGKSCDINLILDQASYINTIIEGPEEKMILPNSMLALSKEQMTEENRVRLSGYVGNTNTEYGNLKINAQGGELIISIKETSIFTNKE